MKDFETRLIGHLKNGLERFWPDIRITGQEHTGKVEHEDWMPAYKALKPKYPNLKYLEVLVHFPEAYIKDNPDWYLEASRIPQACFIILRVLGLDACSADAEVSKKSKHFRFWLPINDRIHQNLPPLPTPIIQKELAIEWEK